MRSLEAVDRELAEVEAKLRDVGWALPLDHAHMAALHGRAAALWRERSLALGGSMRGGIGLFVVAVVLAYGGALVVLGVGLYVATMALTSGLRW